jgi:hypothetical protein
MSGQVLHLERHGICDSLLHSLQHLPARIHVDKEEACITKSLVCSMHTFCLIEEYGVLRKLGFPMGPMSI